MYQKHYYMSLKGEKYVMSVRKLFLPTTASIFPDQVSYLYETLFPLTHPGLTDVNSSSPEFSAVLGTIMPSLSHQAQPRRENMLVSHISILFTPDFAVKFRSWEVVWRLTTEKDSQSWASSFLSVQMEEMELYRKENSTLKGQQFAELWSVYKE